jgi:hypothetical protein
MAYDRYTTTHHLRPDGWSNGDDRPSDAIETWECHVDQPSGWSKETRDWICVWASPEVARASRDAIRTKHKHAVNMAAGRQGDVISTVGEPL